MRSEELDKFLPALAKMQSKVLKATKDSSNPHFKSKYASLEAVLDVITEAIKETGLCYTQTISQRDDNRLYLDTRVFHESGQWIGSEFPLLVPQQTPQAYGSAISYARRYSLSAIFGVVQSDDDGNEASKGPAVVPFVPISGKTLTEITNLLSNEELQERVQKYIQSKGKKTFADLSESEGQILLKKIKEAVDGSNGH
jgi:hypothetical protein